MSGEIENNKEEEPKEPKRPIYLRALEYWQIGLKLLELIFCIVCVSVLYEPIRATQITSAQPHHIGVFYTAFTGFIVVNLVLLIGRVLKDRLEYKTYAIFALVGSGLHLLAGVFLAVDRAYLARVQIFSPQMYLLEELTACSIFAFLNAVVFGIDAAITLIVRNAF